MKGVAHITYKYVLLFCRQTTTDNFAILNLQGFIALGTVKFRVLQTEHDVCFLLTVKLIWIITLSKR